MKPRLVAALAALALVATMTSGCLAQPAPEPTPAFSSEKEAFAAAEATYRAYVDALNEVDLSDPATFEGVYAWTTGDANAGARESFSQMHADGWTVAGETRVQLAEPRSWSAEDELIQLDICLDVSAVTLLNSGGISVVETDRRDVQSMAAQMTYAPDSATGLRISLINGREGAPACDQ